MKKVLRKVLVTMFIFTLMSSTVAFAADNDECHDVGGGTTVETGGGVSDYHTDPNSTP